jgi:hypothetical protein
MTGEQVRKQVDEDRAAVLLGLTRAELQFLGEECGLVSGATDSESNQRLFTYHDLYRLCCWVARPAV